MSNIKTQLRSETFIGRIQKVMSPLQRHGRDANATELNSQPESPLPRRTGVSPVLFMCRLVSRSRCAFATLCFSLLLAIALTGCGKSSSSDQLTLQLNWKPEPQFGGFYAAELDGAYKQHNLNILINPGGVGTPTAQMVGAGKVPFAIVSADEIVTARAQGNNLVALFAVYQTCPQGLMTRASRGFKSIGDIFTHPGIVAMERGLVYAQILKKKYGFDRVQIAPSPGGDLSLYLAKPDYSMQCFVTSEPLAAEKAGVPAKTFLIADTGYNPYTAVLVTSDEFLKAHPDTVKSMIAAVRQGWRDYLDHPNPTNELRHQLNATMDPATFAQSAAVQKPLIDTGGELGAMTLDRWQLLIDQMIEFKAIDRPVQAADCFLK
jgi:NitT/TauT family transport system substrate-binding protein